jgi:putative Mg2+ transporter-C (MgtC) family protein
MSTFALYLDFFVRCFLALLFGAVIGSERELRGKPAGFKTHALISLGACAITFLSLHFTKDGDPGRIAAQIVSGVGFIGAGTILQSRQSVYGLTTAATIWVVSAIGMMVGAGFYLASFIVTLMAILFLLFSNITNRSSQKYWVPYSLNIELRHLDAVDGIEETLYKLGVQITKKSLARSNGVVFVELEIMTTPGLQMLLMKRLMKIKGIGQILRV